MKNNKLEERFDFYKWSAPSFNTSKDVVEYINSLNLYNKTLSRINAIGTVFCETHNSCLCNTLTESIIELNDDCYHTYKKDKIMIPWKITICEPLQLIFNDGTSLEIIPINNGGARIGINSIPQDISDGLNRSNFDTAVFFQELVGISFSGFSLYNTQTEYIKYQFDFGLQYKIILKQNNNKGYYCIEIQRQGELISNIPYELVHLSEKDIKQIEIINGPCGSGMFNIQPINMAKPIEEFLQLDRYGISICEDDIAEFLDIFLKRYYDQTIQEDYRKYANPEFAWYDKNLFAFDAIHKMIIDIRNECTLLLTDCCDSELKIDKERAPITIDFYERFCKQLENMMSLPDKDGILFYGP